MHARLRILASIALLAAAQPCLGADSVRASVVARAVKLPQLSADAALDVLEELRPEEARAAIVRGTDSVVPFLAVHYRGRGAEEVEGIRELALGAPSTVRRVMLLAAAIPSPDLGALAVELLPRSEGSLRAALLDAIEATAPPAAEALLLEMLDETDEVGQISQLLLPLAAVATEASSSKLVELLTHESRGIRRIAARGLGRSGAKGAVLALQKQLPKEQDPATRREILLALGTAGGPTALAELKVCLSAPKKRVERAECLDAVAVAPGIDAVKCLTGILETPRSDLRREAAMALGTRQEELARTALLSAIEREEDPNVFRFLATSLGRLDEKRAARHLAAKLDDPNVALFAALSLAELEDGAGNKVLRAALGYSEYRLLAAEALARIGDRDSLQELQAAYDREKKPEDRARMLVAYTTLARR